MHVLSHRLLVVTGFGLLGITEPSKIRREYEMCLRQLLDQRTPHVARLRVTMQQDDGITFSGNEVMQPQPIYCSEALRDGWNLGVDERDAKAKQSQQRYRPRDSVSPFFYRHSVPFCGSVTDRKYEKAGRGAGF